MIDGISAGDIAVEAEEFCNNGKIHWVEKLFPPMLRFSLSELMSQNLEERNNTDSQFEKLIKKISPEDIDRINNVYHRVWIILKNQKDEHSASEDQESSLLELNEKGVEKTTGNIKKKISSETSNLSENENNDGACIWNSNDINVLRGVYKTIKQDNIKLTSEVMVLKEELLKLKTLQKSEAKQLAIRNEEAQEAIKANKRLEILVKHLKKETDKFNKIIKDLNRTLSETKETNSAMNEEILALCSKLDLERLCRKQDELELQRRLDEMTVEIRHKEQGYMTELEKLQTQTMQKIKILQQQLDNEKELHKRALRGLNHLRMHYGSLPPDETEADPHHLQTWTY